MWSGRRWGRIGATEKARRGISAGLRWGRFPAQSDHAEKYIYKYIRAVLASSTPSPSVHTLCFDFLLGTSRCFMQCPLKDRAQRFSVLTKFSYIIRVFDIAFSLLTEERTASSSWNLEWQGFRGRLLCHAIYDVRAG